MSKMKSKNERSRQTWHTLIKTLRGSSPLATEVFSTKPGCPEREHGVVAAAPPYLGVDEGNVVALLCFHLPDFLLVFLATFCETGSENKALSSNKQNRWHLSLFRVGNLLCVFGKEFAELLLLKHLAQVLQLLRRRLKVCHPNSLPNHPLISAYV
jgi:hypothetical protein